MRNLKKYFVALAAPVLLASSAQAAITVTGTTTPGTGAYAGFDILRWFAAFPTNGPEATAGATGLQSVKTTLTIVTDPITKTVDSDPTHVFQYVNGQFVGASTPSNPDVAIIGERSDDASSRNLTDPGDAAGFLALGSGVFVHDDGGNGFSLQGLFVDGVQKSLSAFNSSNATTNGLALFKNAKSFRVEGFVPQPGGGATGSDPAAKTAAAGQTGAGALFAIAVVPHGALVNATGLLAADKGDTQGFDLTIPVPEPGSLTMIGLGAMGLLARRRRA